MNPWRKVKNALAGMCWIRCWFRPLNPPDVQPIAGQHSREEKKPAEIERVDSNSNPLHASNITITGGYFMTCITKIPLPVRGEPEVSSPPGRSRAMRRNTVYACGRIEWNGTSGRIRNQIAYIAGKKTSVMMVPPNVPPISV